MNIMDKVNELYNQRIDNVNQEHYQWKKPMVYEKVIEKSMMRLYNKLHALYFIHPEHFIWNFNKLILKKQKKAKHKRRLK